ncbi:hypothetical protein [Streptomyces sp. S.PB5]|uniref:hypothetical protein n=1 Tax=Streptomyces sp. S.PB5 TaxID=3020844 RepID=UPI0025B1EB75|nr:hypothetical protein [Streptomyces sp. S.PB5]MDN3022744.1 hypothetical protein [Streptomyces sp. S.PB5]
MRAAQGAGLDAHPLGRPPRRPGRGPGGSNGGIHRRTSPHLRGRQPFDAPPVQRERVPSRPSAALSARTTAPAAAAPHRPRAAQAGVRQKHSASAHTERAELLGRPFPADGGAVAAGIESVGVGTAQARVPRLVYEGRAVYARGRAPSSVSGR